MRRAWVLAAPSLVAADGDSEGLPTVLVEAAASSLPAVGSDHPGLSEVIADQRTGFIVPEGAVEPLAARLADIIASAELRHRLGAAARLLAEARFDSVRQNALLEQHYSVLARSSDRARRDHCAADSR